ncbi:hypothetical protein BGZ65_004764 [Modicella reniformis]|uniref:RING-type domain-containing protein n=1 Tax=Modicella reniformis TaxID=1440133 RepID=A0A9P6SM40_9FUNG|nr:hypothetical protein BGZ65_004764 [Modicella reniformis]
MAIDSTNIGESGRTVRRNVLERMIWRWGNIPRNGRVFLVLTGIMTLVKVASTIAVLIIDDSKRGSQCSYLKILLILYALRSIIGFPFTIYAHMHPREQGVPLTTQDIFLDRQRTLMEITGTCLFFLSNYFLFTAAVCREDAPAVYYLTVAYVILGYIVILIPIILCLAVILCLPLVLRVMQALDIGPAVGIKGATEEMIDAIPIVRYKKPYVFTAEGVSSNVNGDGGVTVDIGETSGDRIEASEGVARPDTSVTVPSSTTASESASTSPSLSSRKKGQFFSVFRKENMLPKPPKPPKTSSQTSSIEYLTLNDPQDAVCAICLCDYEDEEELRKMNCSHYFHKNCVDKWLKLNRNCPLCNKNLESRDVETNSRSGNSISSSRNNNNTIIVTRKSRNIIPVSSKAISVKIRTLKSCNTVMANAQLAEAISF